VYGEPLVNDAIPETFGPCLPISHYAAAKLASEAFISSYSSMHDIKAWICRFPNVIGEHATHGAILDFINKIRKNPDVLEVLGDGSQTKPYLYVKDLVDAVLFIWKNADDVINLYNIAGIGLTSVKEIAEMVITQMGTNTKIQYTGGDRGWKGDSPYYYPDISKLDKLGWMPTFDSSSSVELSIKNILDETKA
jgi:UDP-glucose 4-epimerase